jgi:hypothetical protein
MQQPPLRRRDVHRFVESNARVLESALRSGKATERQLFQMLAMRRALWAHVAQRRHRFATVTPPSEPPPEEGDYATLPRATVDVTIPTVTGSVIQVSSGDVTGLRNAVNTANYDDCIELEAGGQWDISGHAPVAFGPRSGWSAGKFVLIRPSNYLSLAAAHPLAANGMPSNLNLSNPRMLPSRAAALGTPKIRATNQTIGALKMLPQSRGLYVWGIDIDHDPAYSLTNFEVYWSFGTDLNDMATITDIDDIPYSCVLNQCLVRSYPGAKSRKGAAMNIDAHAVVNSYLESHSTEFPESCPLWTCFGRGPYRWENNACLGAGILGFQGGIDLPSWHANEFPRDGTIRHNYFHSPAKWNWNHPDLELTKRENMKNSWEWKNGEYMLFEYNDMDGSWDGGQNGQGMTIKCLNQDGAMDWCSTGNLTVRYNRQRNCGSGWDILSNQQTGAVGQFGRQVHRLYAHNNITLVADSLTERWTGTGRFGIWSSHLQSSPLSGGVPSSWRFVKNTWLTRQSQASFQYQVGLYLGGQWDAPYPVHKDSIFSYPRFRQFSADSIATVQAALDAHAPGITLDNNAFARASSGENEFGTYEGNNQFLADNAALGIDMFTGELDPGSPLKAGGAYEASDGTDKGADYATVTANLVNVDIWE